MAEITVESYTLLNWHYPNDAVELRIFANQYFVSLDGQVFQPASPNQADGIWYQSVECTPDLDAHTLLIPSFDLQPTTNAQPGNCSYNLAFFSGPAPDGQVIVSFEGLTNTIVAADPLVTNLPALININGQPAQSNLFSYYQVFFSIFSQFYSGVAFPDGDTTPSVFNHQTFYTQNTATTNITDFLNSYNQDVIWVFIGDSHTSIFGISRAINSFLQFGHGVDGNWHEITAGAPSIISINALTALAQFIVLGTSPGAGRGPNIVSSVDTHTINLPDAGSLDRGLINTGTQQIAGNKKFLSDIDVGSISAEQKINFPNVNGGNTSLKGSTTAFDLDLVLPPDAGTSGQILSTDGTGTTLWINAGGGGGSDWGVYDPRTYGAVGDGTTNDTTAFLAMLTAIGSNISTVIMPRTGAPFLLGNITFPSNVTLDFFPGGSIQVVTGRTVLIQGLVIAQSIRIFFNVGTVAAGLGVVSFGNASPVNSTDGFTPQQKDYWAEWWGAVGDNVTHSADFLDAAFEALPNGCRMRLAGKFYYLEHGVTFGYKLQCTLIGDFTEVGLAGHLIKPIFVYHGTIGGVVFTAKNVYSCTFWGFGVYGSDGSSPNQAATNILLTFDAAAGANPNISSHCYWVGIQNWALSSRTDWRGIFITNTGGNNEHHTIRECEFAGNDAFGTDQIAIDMAQSQVQRVIIERNNFSSVGVCTQIQGNVLAYNNIYGSVGTVWQSVQANDNCVIIGDDAEQLVRVFDAPAVNGAVTIAFMGCKYTAFVGVSQTALVVADAPIHMLAPVNLSFYNCNFDNALVTGQDFGPFFLGNESLSSPAVEFHNCIIGTASDMSIYGQGFATCHTIFRAGEIDMRWGGNTGESVQLLKVAAPSTAATRVVVEAAGPTNATQPDPLVFGGAYGVGGLFPITPLGMAVVGTPGAATYRITVIGVDAKGRRTAMFTLPNTNHFLATTVGNATLSGSNYLHVTWLAQYPVPDHFAIYDVNPANAVQWRFVANVTPSGLQTEHYDVVANPSGSYVATQPAFNEAGIANQRNLTLFPNDFQFVDGDTTPSIALGNDFFTANSAPTTITNFDDGTASQIIRVRIDDANTTIATNSNIITGYPGNITGVQGGIYTFKNVSGVWHNQFPQVPCELLLATVAGVDMNTATPTTLYTVPTGKTAVITKVVVRNASTSLTTVSTSWGWNSASFNDWETTLVLTALTTSANFRIIPPLNGAKIGTTGQAFKALNNILQGGAATTTMDVFGYLIP